MQADRRKSLAKGWNRFFNIRNKDNRRTSYAAESASIQKMKVSDIKKKKKKKQVQSELLSNILFYQQTIVSGDGYSNVLSLEISQKFK